MCELCIQFVDSVIEISKPIPVPNSSAWKLFGLVTVELIATNGRAVKHKIVAVVHENYDTSVPTDEVKAFETKRAKLVVALGNELHDTVRERIGVPGYHGCFKFKAFKYWNARELNLLSEYEEAAA